MTASHRPPTEGREPTKPNVLGYTLVQSGPGTIRRVQDWLAQTGKSLLSYAVELYDQIDLGNEVCAACGGAFRRPSPGCGVAVMIELRADGNRYYHTRGNLEPDCWPADVPFWRAVISPPEEESDEPVEQLVFFD